ncbi:MAG: MATE family efflux transporter [Coxiellaceae bacterium]|nr:MATE family efflux transporter [Coxiellaceae bacterium]
MPGSPVTTPRNQTDQTPLLDYHVIAPSVNADSLADTESRSQLLKALLGQSWPLMLRGAVVAARYFACAILLAKTDERLLAPNTLINAMESMYMVFAGRSLAILSSEISKLYGEIQKADREKNAEGTSLERMAACEKIITDNNQKIGVVLRHGMLLAGTIGLPIAALYYFANHHILHLLGQHHFAVEKAQDYFQAAAPGFLALNCLTAQQRLLQGLLEPIPVLASNVMHSGLSVLFAYLFLSGKAGFPKLEMDGLGYAFTAASFATVLLNTLYFCMKKNIQPFHIFSAQGGFQPALYKELAKKGLQTGLQNTTENVANMINNIFLGMSGGLTALSASQMSESLALFLSTMSGGLAQAISVCVGKSLGEKKYGTLKQYGNLGIVLGMSFPVMVFITMLFARRSFISLYVNTNNPDNADLVNSASYFLLIACLRQLMTAVQLTTATGGLLGLKDTQFSMLTSIGSSLGLNSAVLCLMHFAFDAKVLALFFATVIGPGITGILNTGRWIMKSYEQSPAELAAVQDATVPYRLVRSVRLFFGGNENVIRDDRRLEEGLLQP